MEIYDYAITAVLPAALPSVERASVALRRPASADLVPAPACAPSVPAAAGALSVPVVVTDAIAVPQQGSSVFVAERGWGLQGFGTAGISTHRTTGINVTTKKRMDLRGVPPRGRPV